MAADEKIALVTGGGSGIGRAAALALQDTGFRVVLAGRRADALQETAGSGKPGALEMLAVPTDLRDPMQIDSLFAAIRETHGRLDVLFNNAGVGVGGIPIEDLGLEDWKRTVDVNLTAAFLCSQQAIRMMKQQTPRGGRIINNGSVSAHVPRPDSVAYTATKHAMTGLTKSIALEGRRHDISCSQIDIGNADTSIGEAMKRGMPQANDEIMVEPVMDPKHCGDVVAYIAGLPTEANVLFMTIMATKMPYVGRG
jgi:NAD(P)-dependent dehydrogenase (short-subunit alcohol dehydrogenase family)